MIKYILFILIFISCFVGCSMETPNSPASQGMAFAGRVESEMESISLVAPIDNATNLTNPVTFEWVPLTSLTNVHHYTFHWSQDRGKVLNSTSAKIVLGDTLYPITINKADSSHPVTTLSFSLRGFGRFIDVPIPPATSPNGRFDIGWDTPIVHYWKMSAWGSNGELIGESSTYSFWMKLN